MNKKILNQSDLSQFIGSTIWYRHGLVRHVHYTEGVRYLAEVGGAYWLIDEIAFSQATPEVKAEPFQFWKLSVNTDQTAILSCEDGDDNNVYTKKIEFTDFPLPEIKLYYTDTIILLPSEY